MKAISLMFVLCFGIQLHAQTKKIKVACIGASITYGHGIPERENNSFPGQLQSLLGNKYEVGNYGVSGTTLLQKGNSPYTKTKQYQQALDSNPDIVFIDLGANDSKLVNRIHLNEFNADFKALIQSFSQLSSRPRIVLLIPIVSFYPDTNEIWNPVIAGKIIPRVKQVAYDNHVELLDLYSLFVDRADLLPDKIHPNLQGASLMAGRMFELLQQPRDTTFNILKKLKIPQKSVSFHGYESADFTFNGRDCKIVRPKWTAKDRPWVWRARFWGHEPQTDIALLERGYHIVFCDVAELFGNKEAVDLWNSYYRLLTKNGLAKKAVLEGMSRGAVYVFNWAAVNPGKIRAVYVDNPVLDLKTWPAGLGRVPVSKSEFEQFKTDFNLTTEAEVKQFKGSPIDKVKEIIAGRYPILILCADADEAVAPEENTYLFEKEVRELKGNITVIHKPGFKHHPHSLPNPTPIVDFILKANKGS